MGLVRNFWKLTRWARALLLWLLLLLAFAAWAGFGQGQAHAQSTENCMNLDDWGDGVVPYCGTREEAFQAVQAIMELSTVTPAPLQYGGGVCGGGANVFAYKSSGRKPGSVVNITICRRIVNAACPPGQEWFDGIFNRCDTTCESRPASTTLFAPKSGSIQCIRGCMRSYYDNGDDETMTTQSTGQRCEGRSTDCAAIPPERGNFYWNPYLGVCEPSVAECPEGMKPVNGKCERNDFCPVGQILNEHNVCEQRDGDCPAGSTRSLEGMCVDLEDDQGNALCPEGQARGSDGTCKFDDDGDGDPDEDDGKFSGGDDCSVPPTCSGDSIMCGQARIQWRIDCNTRRNQKISGGGCSPRSMPVCVGESCDLMEYAQLMQQWNTRCAVEKLADGLLEGGEGGGPGGPGDGEDGKDGDFDPYAAGQDDADSVSDDGVEADAAFTDESNYEGLPGGTGELDSGGLGFSRSCVQLPVLQVMGASIDFNANGAAGTLCDWMRLGGQFVLIISAIVAIRIMSSGGAT